MGFNLEKFLLAEHKNSEDYETRDGAEFILCEMCRYNHGDGCSKENYLGSCTIPEDFYHVCQGFKSLPVAISPSKFTELMKAFISVNMEPGDIGLGDSRDELRFQLEFLMCEMLNQLGYGEGARIFQELHFEMEQF